MGERDHAARGLDVERVHVRWIRKLLGGDEPLPMRQLLAYAVLFGLGGGLLEALYLTARQFVTGLLATGYYVELLWMAPLSGAVTFVLIALVMAFAGRVARCGVALSSATFVFAFVAFHGVFQSPGIPLHPLAELVWSLGVASLAAKSVSDHPRLVRSTVRRAPALVLGSVSVLTVFAILRLPPVAELRASRALPPAESGLPNVLLIILDTVRAASLGLYGYDRNTTPYLEAWAEDGLVFERAYTTAPWTLPAHASLFTGRYPFETGTDIDVPLGPEFPTLAEALAGRGYATSAFVANLLYTTPTSGLDRGFARYRAHALSPAQVARSYWVPRAIETGIRKALGWAGSPTKDGARVTREFFAWLDDRDDRPFFAFLNYFDAHDPYEPPEPYRTMFGPGPAEPWGPWVNGLGAAEDSASRRLLDEWIQRYDGGIAYVDRQIGLVHERLQDEGLLDNTIVVITSDHGEAWGEHGLVGHLNGLYAPLVHVPLLVSYPGRLADATRVASPVTIRDIPATILELAGLGGGAGLPGNSLVAPALGTGPPSASPVLAELRAYQGARPRAALIEDGFHYLRTLHGSEELYDLAHDPHEERNLATAPEHATRIGDFRSRLLELGVTPRR